MNVKKLFASSLLTLAATGFTASPAVAAEDESTGDYSQNVNIIDDVCPTVQDIDLLITVELIDESAVAQCNGEAEPDLLDS